LRRSPFHLPAPFAALPVVSALVALLAAAGVQAQVDAPAPAASAASATPAASAASAPSTPPRRGSIVLMARELRGRPDLETVAEGDAEFLRDGVRIRADQLSYEQIDDLALARGNVRVSRDGNVFSGPEMQVKVQRFEGYFQSPTYFFSRAGAGGHADRIDFLGEQRSVATGATYSSCPADGSGDPAWLLRTSRVSLDFDANEGIAENAVLRFYGVPILAAPVLSFPLTDERKSGWLPPSIGLDSKSGLQLSAPYYWNIAPNRDATLTPVLSVRRGVGADAEFRYLEPSYQGKADLTLLPNDRTTGNARHAFDLQHDAELAGSTSLRLRALRVSDDAYWKDFPRGVDSLTPRLLATDLKVAHEVGAWSTYARVQTWQVLQSTDVDAAIVAPYERTPQIGARFDGALGGGLQAGFEAEFNRFENPPDSGAGIRPTGLRLHALGQLSWPHVTPGWSLTPKLSFNAASYSLDEAVAGYRQRASRVVPTLSVDSAWVLERDSTWFGRKVRQTLEPRLLYVRTPFRDQSQLPNFDSAAKDFNFESIYTENAFSGVDRVSDSHQLTAGVTTRLIDADTGAEALRLGLVQRYLFRDQNVTLTQAPDDLPLTQRFSDVLLLGSTSLVPRWTLDASLQYRPETNRTVRSVVSARYSPGPFRTVGVTYRLARDLSEQVETAWQWPIFGQTPVESRAAAAASSGTSACNGSLYSVGRINYSKRDSRITDSVIGFEYDAGCWIGRVVAERLSTGRSEATTRLLFQLELVGLSRLNVGSNPLQVLKDNVPGFQLLREDRLAPAPSNTP
jgi:LPS-assembly protein